VLMFVIFGCASSSSFSEAEVEWPVNLAQNDTVIRHSTRDVFPTLQGQWTGSESFYSYSTSGLRCGSYTTCGVTVTISGSSMTHVRSCSTSTYTTSGTINSYDGTYIRWTANNAARCYRWTQNGPTASFTFNLFGASICPSDTSYVCVTNSKDITESDISCQSGCRYPINPDLSGIQGNWLGYKQVQIDHQGNCLEKPVLLPVNVTINSYDQIIFKEYNGATSSYRVLAYSNTDLLFAQQVGGIIGSEMCITWNYDFLNQRVSAIFDSKSNDSCLPSSVTTASCSNSSSVTVYTLCLNNACELPPTTSTPTTSTSTKHNEEKHSPTAAIAAGVVIGVVGIVVGGVAVLWYYKYKYLPAHKYGNNLKLDAARLHEEDEDNFTSD